MSAKIVKAEGAALSEFEEKVAQELANFEAAASNEDIKPVLQELHATEARQLKSDSGKECIVVTIPYKLLSKFRVVQGRLVRELEKKFSGHHVVVVAQRTIQAPSGGKVQRPRSRTLTAVHEALLEDVVHPLEIVGKRTRVNRSGKMLKVFLDPKEHSAYETKLETFQTVYQKLTGKRVEFTFPVEEKA